MYGFIYLTTNNIDDKKYIGQKKYIKGWKDYLGSGIHLKNAIKKYGKENFSKEIIEECKTKEIADEREIYWIKFYDAVDSNKFYNIASGGDGGNTLAGYSEEELRRHEKHRLEMVRKNISKGEDSGTAVLKEKEVKDIILRLQNNEFNLDISVDYSVSCGTIDDIRQHKTWKHLTKGIVFDDISNRKRPATKPINQYDMQETYITTYKSAREAENQTGIGYKMISRVCRGERPHTHGYIFKFMDDVVHL